MNHAAATFLQLVNTLRRQSGQGVMNQDGNGSVNSAKYFDEIYEMMIAESSEANDYCPKMISAKPLGCLLNIGADHERPG